MLDVPRAFHDAHPRAQRPALRPTWDVFGWSLLILTLVGLAASAIFPAVLVFFPGPGPVALAMGYALVFIAVTWFLLSRLLIYRGTPWLLAGAAVLWGMTGAFLLGAFTVSERLIDLSYSWNLDEFALSLGGAYPEELAKGLGVWLLLHVGRAWWNRPWHGLVAGMLVGIGFEAFENIGYAVMFSIYDPHSDLAGVSGMWLFRLVAGPLLHGICTGLVGFGIGMAVYSAGLTWQRRLAWVLGAGTAGFLVHAGWNLQLDSVVASVVNLVFFWTVGAVLLVTSIVISTKEARTLAAAGLYPAVSIYQRIPVAPPQAPQFPR
ncbi:PrsW family intramembrane metalloprotease [Corynebacterium sp. USCH3]|uniref:PrsW family intramembrane metalloprotease n=1 Tax=Corynebacterium sp. USCH3 TaxID=3024840 RepID=UPI003095460A